MTTSEYQDLLARIKRIECRLVQLMYFLGARLDARYDVEED